MTNNNSELQRRFKERMYNAGLKQMIVWVKRREEKAVDKITKKEFIAKIKKLTNGWDERDMTKLYSLLIKVVKGNKEAKNLIRKK